MTATMAFGSRSMRAQIFSHLLKPWMSIGWSGRNSAKSILVEPPACREARRPCCAGVLEVSQTAVSSRIMAMLIRGRAKVMVAMSPDSSKWGVVHRITSVRGRSHGGAGAHGHHDAAIPGLDASLRHQSLIAEEEAAAAEVSNAAGYRRCGAHRAP